MNGGFCVRCLKTRIRKSIPAETILTFGFNYFDVWIWSIIQATDTMGQRYSQKTYESFHSITLKLISSNRACSDQPTVGELQVREDVHLTFVKTQAGPGRRAFNVREGPGTSVEGHNWKFGRPTERDNRQPSSHLQKLLIPESVIWGKPLIYTAYNAIVDRQTQFKETVSFSSGMNAI